MRSLHKTASADTGCTALMPEAGVGTEKNEEEHVGKTTCRCNSYMTIHIAVCTLHATTPYIAFVGPLAHLLTLSSPVACSCSI